MELYWEHLIDIAVIGGMIDHIKNGNEGVLICVAKWSIIDEEVTPFIAVFELFKTDLFFGKK